MYNKKTYNTLSSENYREMENILKINDKQENVCVINTDRKEKIPSIHKGLSNKKRQIEKKKDEQIEKSRNKREDNIQNILNNNKFKCLKKCVYKNCYCESVLKFNKNEKHKDCNEKNDNCYYISCTKGCKSKITNQGLRYCEGTIQNSNKKLVMPPNFCDDNRFYKYCGSSKVTNNKLNEKCLQEIWINSGCKKLGSLYPNKNNPIFDTIWYNKNLEEAKTYIKKLYERAVLSGDIDATRKCLDKLHISEKNKKYETKKCRDNFKGNISPYDIKCLQKIWNNAGCTKNGSGYPTIRYNSSNYFFCNPTLKKCNILDLNPQSPKICWANCNKKQLNNDIKLLYIKAKSGNQNAKLKCLGHTEAFTLPLISYKRNILLLTLLSIFVLIIYNRLIN